MTAIDLPSEESIVLVIDEGIYNETAAHSLLTEFQLREFGKRIDSMCDRHGGMQQMTKLLAGLICNSIFSPASQAVNCNQQSCCLVYEG
jgi:hypothetical protein